MKTKEKVTSLLTMEDERQAHARGLGTTFQCYRKKANLTLREVSKALAKNGVKLSFTRLGLFERGGADKYGNFPTGESLKAELHPDVLAALVKLYDMPPQISTEIREGYGKFLDEIMLRAAVKPLLGKPTELNSARVEISMLRVQLDREKRLNATLMQTIDALQALIRGTTRPLLGTNKESLKGFVPPVGTGEKLLGRKK